MNDRIRNLVDWIRSLHPTLLSATGMAAVAVVLLGASFSFGVFGSNYDLDGPYDQIYPASPGSTP